MSEIPVFIPREGGSLRDAEPWIRAVTQRLRGQAGQTRAVRSFAFNDAHPPPVTTPGAAKPLGVLLLSASQPKGVGPITSGAAVTWTWTPLSAGGAILVTGIAGLAASTDYDVTIEIVGS